jgi:MFS family permease
MAIAPTAPTPPAPTVEIHPERTLWLLSIAHAVNHAQAVLLPLVYLQILGEFDITLADVTPRGGRLDRERLMQLSFAKLTRVVSGGRSLDGGGILFGGGFAAQAIAPTFGTFAAVNVASRIGGAPQHPVGNGLLAEQFPEERRGFAISAHISGGNVGTVVVAVVGAAMITAFGWRWVVVLFGIPAVVIAIAILLFVRESGVDRRAAVAHGSVRDAFRTVLADRPSLDLPRLGPRRRRPRARVVNLFALAYLTLVIGLPMRRRT